MHLYMKPCHKHLPYYYVPAMSSLQANQICFSNQSLRESDSAQPLTYFCQSGFDAVVVCRIASDK